MHAIEPVAAGIYNHLPKEDRPTFHELIALGEHLRGHTQEKTTKVYLEGHEWTTVDIPVASKR